MDNQPSPLLSLQGINFTYRALPVLKGINWVWQTGEQWACLGPNGAGKTTLARLISRQLDHASGTITRADALEHGGIAYVCFEQQKALCDRDTKLDDSDMRGDASDPGTTVRRAICGDKPPAPGFLNWTERLGVTHILERGIRFISTGEMRKTLLLKAILGNPQLLILDSPLDGLDISSQAEIEHIIAQLLASELHILLLVRQLQDLPAGVTHLLVLERGETVASGSRRQVLADGSVEALMNPPLPALLDLPTPAARPYQLAGDEPLLILRDVEVAYGEVTVLESVDWTFSPGQHCCISGPNGCGKTTLLSLINGDSHKAYGQDITLFGRRRGSGESVWDIKRKFGLLNTRLQLGHVRGMRVPEVVISGFFDTVGLYDDWGDAQRKVAHHWLRALGMEHLAPAPFDTLSFGMQRMVLLARAMVKSPVILILDEPCLGLDGNHTQIILRAIDHIAANSDTRILFVSHCAGQTPACINQWLDFRPGERGFTLQCRAH